MNGFLGNLAMAKRTSTTVPLAHFLVATGFLNAGVLPGLVSLAGVSFGRPVLAQLHLLLACWVAITNTSLYTKIRHIEA